MNISHLYSIIYLKVIFYIPSTHNTYGMYTYMYHVDLFEDYLYIYIYTDRHVAIETRVQENFGIYITENETDGAVSL